MATPPDMSEDQSKQQPSMESLQFQAMFKLTAALDSLTEKVNKREIAEPEPFCLGTGRSIEEFLSEFEAFADQKYGVNREVWCSKLGRFLGEPVNQLYCSIRAVGANYATVKKRLIETYGSVLSTKTCVDYMQEFHQSTYNPDEGIPGLVCRLRTLAGEAYRGLAEDDLETLVKQQCWRVLPAHLRNPLQFQSLANPTMRLDELVRLGVSLQKTELSSAGLYAMGSAGPSAYFPAPTPKEDKTPLATVQPSLPQPASPAVIPKRCNYCRKPGHVRSECNRLNKACFGCGETGHIRSRCPHRQAEARPSRSTSVSPGRRQDSGTTSTANCAFCGAPGHLMAACEDFEAFMRRMMRQLN